MEYISDINVGIGKKCEKNAKALETLKAGKTIRMDELSYSCKFLKV